MKINLIIGAGQLGSRHLQGLLKIKESQKVYIVDPSSESLEIAKQRALEVSSLNNVEFHTNWDNLPLTFDLVIVATAANVRAKIVKNLLANYEVKNLVLEKILFQDLVSYDEINKLIVETNTPTWVNHPRRLATYYQEIQRAIEDSKEVPNFYLEGSNWGLACSALHFIDLFAYLSSSEVQKMDLDWIDSNLHKSKRENYIEFTGVVKGVLNNGSKFMISSMDGDIGDITIIITTNSCRWIVQEGKAKKIIYLGKENDFVPVISDFEIDFQSSITTTIAENIFENNCSMLPTYQEACASHIPFIEAALEKYNELSGQSATICPIT